MPEEPAPVRWTLPEAWLEADLVPGGIACTMRANFDVPPTAIRFLTPGAEHLVCAYGEILAESKDVDRVRIAERMDLVFTGGIYSGWMLHRPADHLVTEWEHPPAGPAPAGLTAALETYLRLFTYSNIELMQEGDTDLLSAIDSLIARLASLPHDPRGTVIEEHLRDVRQEWYRQPRKR
ncbi:hypothetical protein [Streptomyces pactum]|uniref:hypothetical protein n=1 Tax=Streptomyces pactum TaxID=68249 RepID=UPI0036F7CAA3